MIHALAKQLGQWLAAALHRVPTKGETDILLQELAEMPNPCSTTDVADAIKRAADRLARLAGMGSRLQEITVAAMESTQWARLQAIIDSLPPLAPPAGTQ